MFPLELQRKTDLLIALGVGETAAIIGACIIFSPKYDNLLAEYVSLKEEEQLEHRAFISSTMEDNTTNDPIMEMAVTETEDVGSSKEALDVGSYSSTLLNAWPTEEEMKINYPDHWSRSE